MKKNKIKEKVGLPVEEFELRDMDLLSLKLSGYGNDERDCEEEDNGFVEEYEGEIEEECESDEEGEERTIDNARRSVREEKEGPENFQLEEYEQKHNSQFEENRTYQLNEIIEKCTDEINSMPEDKLSVIIVREKKQRKFETTPKKALKDHWCGVILGKTMYVKDKIKGGGSGYYSKKGDKVKSTTKEVFNKNMAEQLHFVEGADGFVLDKLPGLKKHKKSIQKRAKELNLEHKIILIEKLGQFKAALEGSRDAYQKIIDARYNSQTFLSLSWFKVIVKFKTPKRIRAKRQKNITKTNEVIQELNDFIESNRNLEVNHVVFTRKYNVLKGKINGFMKKDTTPKFKNKVLKIVKGHHAGFNQNLKQWRQAEKGINRSAEEAKAKITEFKTKLRIGGQVTRLSASASADQPANDKSCGFFDKAVKRIKTEKAYIQKLHANNPQDLRQRVIQGSLQEVDVIGALGNKKYDALMEPRKQESQAPEGFEFVGKW